VSFSKWTFRGCLCVGLLQIGSCTKSVDKVTNDSISLESSSDAVGPDLSKCKIRRIYQQNRDGVSGISAVFTYNSVGNPYSVYYEGGEVPNQHYFKYDASKRLTEWVQWWGTQEWEHHYYKYNAKNQINIDSAVSMDAIGIPHRSNLSTIEYDAQGRVVKETIVNLTNDGDPIAPTRRPTYTYDSRGNLGVAGWKSSSYDNKINPLRQNPIFQFIFRNYSMNNASVQPKYNSTGLPLSSTHNNDQFFNHVEVTKIIYDCP
jgi:hypothetical protein